MKLCNFYLKVDQDNTKEKNDSLISLMNKNAKNNSLMNENAKNKIPGELIQQCTKRYNLSQQ